MQTFNNFNHAYKFYEKVFNEEFYKIIETLKINQQSFNLATKIELEATLEIVNNSLMNTKFIERNTHNFFENEDYRLCNSDEKIGFTFSIKDNLKGLQLNLLQLLSE